MVIICMSLDASMLRGSLMNFRGSQSCNVWRLLGKPGFSLEQWMPGVYTSKSNQISDIQFEQLMVTLAGQSGCMSGNMRSECALIGYYVRLEDAKHASPA